jgi:hypothetical protein
MRNVFYASFMFLLLAQQAICQVTVYPAPKGSGVALSDSWIVSVDGVSVPVYRADVYRDGPACFCSFDFSGAVEVSVRPMMECSKPVLRPLSAGIIPVLCEDHTISFRISDAGQYSLEPRYYTSSQPLLIFANPPEENIPAPDDPEVLYYGPGLHRVTTLDLRDKHTLYLAGGAYLKVFVPDDELPVVACDEVGMPRFKAMLFQKGRKGITVRGRGIVDLGAVPWHGRVPFSFQSCMDVIIDGITVVDSPSWTVCFGKCKKVLVNNVKLIGHRENSDGVDIVSSRDVAVRNCFIRTGDDGVCVKTINGPARDVVVERSVVWNDRVRGIGIAGESQSPIENITFRDIDIIHDLSNFSQGYSLTVYIEESGPVEKVLFDDIRIEDARNRLIQVAVSDKALEQQSSEIKNITFRNIQYLGRNMPQSLIRGAGASHEVKNIQFENCTFQAKKVWNAQDMNLEVGGYAKKISFE